MDQEEVDLGLKYLLELDGEIFPMDNGYWTKFEARMVQPNSKMPHGIRYSLTLHDRNNERVLGYDNAHRVKTNKGKFKAKRIEWDHKHQKDSIKIYEFESVGQLIEDFWNDVNRIVK